MPFYEYQCSQCDHFFEAMQKISDAPLRKCPACGRNALKKLVSAPVFRLKGSGWYETDFKSDQERKRNLAAAEQESAPKDKGQDKGTGAAESKPAGESSGSAPSSAKPEAAAGGTAAAEKPAAAASGPARSPAPAPRSTTRTVARPSAARPSPARAAKRVSPAKRSRPSGARARPARGRR